VRALKIAAIVLVVYVGIVVLFESLIGYFQPAGETTLTITTTSPDGASADRVLSTLELDDALYVAANHWPRSWYTDVLANPEVEVTRQGERGSYLAVPVSPEEHEALQSAHPLGPIVRFLTGFPPRYFVRLDPR
jgi:hypothetical protein